MLLSLLGSLASEDEGVDVATRGPGAEETHARNARKERKR